MSRDGADVIVVLLRISIIIDVDMNNRTTSTSARGYLFSLGHLAPMFSLLFTLLIILTILFFLFVKQRDTNLVEELELPSDFTSSGRERKSLRGESVRQYSSIHSCNINELDARSTVNLLSSE